MKHCTYRAAQAAVWVAVLQFPRNDDRVFMHQAKTQLGTSATDCDTAELFAIYNQQMSQYNYVSVVV